MRTAAALVLAVLVGCDRAPSLAEDPSPEVPRPAPVTIAAGTRDLVDPLAPGRKLWRVAEGAPAVAGWLQRPSFDTQYSIGRDERGVNPCEAPDPGFGVLTEWQHLRPRGQFVAPRAGALREDGSFDLVIHFHGHRPARKELARTGEDLVMLGVSLGIGAAYGPPFSDPKLVEGLVAQIEKKLGAQSGKPAKVRHLALSSWSRGYEAVEKVLAQPIGKKVDALVLLDSLHASRDAKRRAEQLRPFVEFAARAAKGEKFFFASHSSIDPPSYASTTETVHALVDSLGGRPAKATRKDPLGLDLIELYTKGDFHARGYSGNGKLDHCAHFGIFPDALRALARRWRQ